MALYDVTGTIADWVMAGAAVYASYNAKGWISQRSHSKGLDKAEDLIYRIDNLFKEIDNSIFDLYKTNQDLRDISGGSPANASLEGIFKSFSKSRSISYSKVEDLKDDIDLLKRWAIDVVDIEVINAILVCLECCIMASMNTFNMASKSIYILQMSGRVAFEKQLIIFNSTYDSCIKEFDTITPAYDAFKSKRFNELFKIK